jgi:hypothetical protein
MPRAPHPHAAAQHVIGMQFANRMAERFSGGSIQAGDDAAGDAEDSAELAGSGNDQRVSLASGVRFEMQVRYARSNPVRVETATQEA